MTGRKLGLQEGLQSSIGAYIEASTDAIVTNDMSPRTKGCLLLGLSGNLQGSLKFFDLETGKVVVRHSFKVLPMPNRLAKLANPLGANFARDITSQDQTCVLNRVGDAYDWASKSLDIDSNLFAVPDSTAHPSIPEGNPRSGAGGIF